MKVNDKIKIEFGIIKEEYANGRVAYVVVSRRNGGWNYRCRKRYLWQAKRRVKQLEGEAVVKETMLDKNGSWVVFKKE
jgi:hypothetical protein